MTIEGATNAANGRIVLYPASTVSLLPDPVDLTITLEPSPASVPFSAPGLTLGGTARWRRVWYYPNLSTQ